jgi:hypothetical protein
VSGTTKEIGTYRDVCGHQITLVEQEQQVLVRSFFPDVLFDTSAASAQRISCVKDVDDHI